METRYPKDLQITIADFNACNLADVLAGIPQKNYLNYWIEFSKVAQAAMNANEPAKGKIFWLLSDVCSLSLTPSNTNQPYGLYGRCIS